MEIKSYKNIYRQISNRAMRLSTSRTEPPLRYIKGRFDGAGRKDPSSRERIHPESGLISRREKSPVASLLTWISHGIILNDSYMQ